MGNLEAAGMRVEFVPDGHRAARYPVKVNFIAGILDMKERGAEMIDAYKEQVAEIADRVERMERNPGALLILSISDGSPFVAGRETTGHDIIEIAGGTNMADFEGWKPMSAEAVIAAAPEVIFLSSFHVKRMGGIEAVMNLPAILSTPAGATRSFVVLNSNMMLQFGPRSPVTIAEMNAALEAIQAQ